MKILVISDIHGNWTALQAVLAAEPKVDQILCLGDLVNYGPQPAECVAWAMKTLAADWWLQGNHDHAVGRNSDPHCSPAYQLLAAATQEVSKRLLSSAMKRCLARLEPLKRLTLGGAKCVACHATPSDPLFTYLTEQSAPTLWESELVQAGHPDLLFLGHTHVPMKTQFQRSLVINPGSVGQPKHGDPRAAYAVWDDGAVKLRRVSYDVERTVRAYDGLGLEPHIAHTLCEGLRTGGRPTAANQPEKKMP
jgi:predicted phosphodiesterase